VEETHQLVDALKRCVKARGLTYRILASRVGLSEASVKRIFANRSFTIRKNWSEPNPQYVLGVTHVDAGPTTPVGIVTYARELKPGETWTLDFKMPVIPTADPFAIIAIDDASFDTVETQMREEPASER